MNVLIVGAGSVGQVYGYHLQKGGARVAVLVKPKHAEEAKRGFTLHRLGRCSEQGRLDGLDVYTQASELRGKDWDQIWLCMSSTGLRAPGLKELFEATGDATIVAMQPGLDDQKYMLEQGLDPQRLVSGMISMVSYSAPLEGESEKFSEPGTAYWLPPLSPSPFSGPAERVAKTVEALNRGGQPAVVRPDVPQEVAFPSAVFMVLVAGLEEADWSLRTLRDGANAKRTASAMREALGVIERRLGKKAPLSVRALSSAATLKALAHLAPKVVPFPFETYMRKHFTKVGDQTRLAIAGFITDARKQGVTVDGLSALAGRLT